VTLISLWGKFNMGLLQCDGIYFWIEVFELKYMKSEVSNYGTPECLFTKENVRN